MDSDYQTATTIKKDLIIIILIMSMNIIDTHRRKYYDPVSILSTNMSGIGECGFQGPQAPVKKSMAF
ncbi:MAG: hypothetical protein D6160_13780 [Ketobacter sp.]|nr:MAG: hypothetical protein D6160_13780 [Ketobacter sp.]